MDLAQKVITLPLWQKTATYILCIRCRFGHCERLKYSIQYITEQTIHPPLSYLEIPWYHWCEYRIVQYHVHSFFISTYWYSASEKNALLLNTVCKHFICIYVRKYNILFCMMYCWHSKELHFLEWYFHDTEMVIYKLFSVKKKKKKIRS